MTQAPLSSPQAPAGILPPLPHDIYDALPVHWPWWVWGLIVLVVVLTIPLAIYLMRKWREHRARVKPVGPVDPWETLAARLKGMLAPMDFPVGRPQEDHYYAMSLLLREAIEMRTKIPATDLTLQELRDPLRKKLPLETSEVEAVLNFLERADLVKFAGRPSDRPEAEVHRARIAGWLESLKPKSIDVNEQSPWSREATR